MREYTTEQFQKDQESSKRAEPIFLSWWLDITPEYAKWALDMLEMISNEEAWEESKEHYKSKFFNLWNHYKSKDQRNQ